MNGVINVLKPPGMTSHDVVAYLRRQLGEKRIGHAGTLDPQAAGVLPVCLGQATRLLEYMSLNDKDYLCHLTLGCVTTTQDAWGAVVEQKDASHIRAEDLTETLKQFCGKVEQLPPMYSALKVKGVPLYRHARSGETVERQLRPIFIEKLELLEFSWPIAKLFVRCSKGTYIRTLCHDIGQRMGVGGHLSFLLRTRVGGFNLHDSFTLEDIVVSKEKILLPPETCVQDLQRLVLEPQDLQALKFGQKVALTHGVLDVTQPVAILNSYGSLFAIATVVGKEEQLCLKPQKVFAGEMR